MLIGYLPDYRIDKHIDGMYYNKFCASYAPSDLEAEPAELFTYDKVKLEK